MNGNGMTTHFGPESHAVTLDEIAGRQPQRPIQPETPLTVTLAAGEWNVVQAALRELPMKYVEQLSQKIARQVFAEAYGNPTTMEQQP